jgi:lysophospholipase L1-like esterase
MARFLARVFGACILPLFSMTAALAQQAATPPPKRVACVGDSITYGIGSDPGKSYPSQLQAQLGPGWLVGNFGVSGRTLLRKGDYPYWREQAFRQVLAGRPDVVVIMLGTNDTKPQNWRFHDEFYNDYRDMVRMFLALPGKPRVYVCRPCPVPEPGNYGINEAGILQEIPLIDRLSREEGVGVIDIHAALAPHPELLPDRVHPNTDGAAIIASTVAATLTGDLGAPASTGAVGKTAPKLPSALKLMPLGDSITFGYNGTNAGYRGPLYNLLSPIAPGLQFVGSSTEGVVTTLDSPLPKNQRHNEGHASYAIVDIARNLDGEDSKLFKIYGEANRDPNGGHWLTGESYTPAGSRSPVRRAAVYPDIITLMIGTNDNGAGPTTPPYEHAAVKRRLHDLLAKLTIMRPSCKVFLAKITPRGAASNVDDYNTIVAEEAAAFRAAGKSIYLVDLNTGFPVSTGLTEDGVHPNDVGFVWIAQKWYETIVSAYAAEDGAGLDRRAKP